MGRVLVVEDDLAIAELMRSVLEDAGHTTILAVDAGSLPAGPVDCVVTDLVDLTVYSSDAARGWIVRLRERYADTPIVLVTAHPGVGRDGDRLGVQRVIMKPFDVELLHAAVKAVTAEQRTFTS